MTRERSGPAGVAPRIQRPPKAHRRRRRRCPRVALVNWMRTHHYVVPVVGTLPAEIQNTFGAFRPGSRPHLGTDILAPRGTTVVAAADGVIWDVATTRLGGNVIWIFGRGG